LRNTISHFAREASPAEGMTHDVASLQKSEVLMYGQRLLSMSSIASKTAKRSPQFWVSTKMLKTI